MASRSPERVSVNELLTRIETLERQLQRRSSRRHVFSRKMVAIAMTVVTALSLTTGAYASIPDSGGVIYACYGPAGVRIVNSTTECKRNEQSIFWLQQGAVHSVRATSPLSVTGTGSDPIINLDGTIPASNLPDLAGDVTGAPGSNTVSDLQGQPLSISNPSSGQVLRYGGSQFANGNLQASDIPNLDASKITSGTLDTGRIPNLDASKITTGTLDTGRIPNLDASKISTGTLDSGRIPDLSSQYVSLNNNATVGGTKTFSNAIHGDVTGSAGSFTGSLSGDVTGTQGSTAVQGLQGTPLSNTAPNSGDVLKFNGTKWVPAAAPTSGLQNYVVNESDDFSVDEDTIVDKFYTCPSGTFLLGGGYTTPQTPDDLGSDLSDIRVFEDGPVNQTEWDVKLANIAAVSFSFNIWVICASV